MARKNKPFPLSLIIIAVLVLLIYFMKDGTLGIGEGQNEEENLSQDTSAINAQPEITTDIVEEDTLTVIVSIDSLEKKTVDSLQNLSDTTALLTYNTLWVTKKNDSLYFNINQKTYTNLLLGMAEANFTLPYRVKLAGNLTYAEERDIKDILEEKDINFTIEE